MAKSTKKKFLSFFNLLILFVLFCCLSGCGNSESVTVPCTGTDCPSAKAASLILSIPSSILTFGTPGTATATVRDANGNLVDGAVVTFMATSDIVTFTPASATALTYADGINHGVASITLNVASTGSAGATSIIASAPVTTNGTTTTVTSTPVGIAVNGAAVTIHSLTLGSPSISSYGTSSVSALVWVNSSTATVPISVTFTSSCVSAGKATLSSPVTTISGTATSTYKDNNCALGSDVITASVTGSTANATITVAIPATNNIQFVSATPAIIGTQGGISTPTLPQNSLVKFKVVDNNNNGKAGVLVDFSLLPTTVLGNITLSPTSATSDSNGEVTTSLTSGAVPTPVWVVAKVHDTPTILSQSNTLTITTGLPTQNLLSLSYTPWNIEGLEHDGVESKILIIASDRLGNPVPDGTAINFVTPQSESGQINPASCTTIHGTCTVTYSSSGTRPADGRATILAYAVGEKSFVDSNGNNMYDTGETFYDLGDLYVDSNENGSWDTGEQFFAPYTPLASPVACMEHYWSGGTEYTTPLTGDYGIKGSIPNKDGTCSGVWGVNYVRRDAVIVLSSSHSRISPTTVTMESMCRKKIKFMVTDLSINNNPMPMGTTVETANNNVTYIPNGATSTSKATASIIYGTPIENSTDAGGTSVTLLVDADCSAGTPVSYPQGDVDIVTTSPLGQKDAWNITVNP